MTVRLMLLKGVPIPDIATQTGLAVEKVAKASDWLNGKDGKRWALFYREAQRAALDRDGEDEKETPLNDDETSSPEKSGGPGPRHNQRSVFKSTRPNGLPQSPPGGDGGELLYRLEQVPDETTGGVRTMYIPVQGTQGKGRGTINVTARTLEYYDRMVADWLAEQKTRIADPKMIPNEYPGGLSGFVEECIVRYFKEILGKELIWVDV